MRGEAAPGSTCTVAPRDTIAYERRYLYILVIYTMYSGFQPAGVTTLKIIRRYLRARVTYYYYDLIKVYIIINYHLSIRT